MLDVKQAVKTTAEYLIELYKSQSETLSNLRLEEVELTEDDRYWMITFGFDVPVEKQPDVFSSLSLLPHPKPVKMLERDYKIVKIDAETGKFHSMKIREVREA